MINQHTYNIRRNAVFHFHESIELINKVEKLKDSNNNNNNNMKNHYPICIGTTTSS